MTRLRALQDFDLYRTITPATVEDVAEADWIADLITELGVATARETARGVYGAEDLIVSAFFRDNTDTVEVEPHYYNENDELIAVGDKQTLTPTTSSSDVVEGAQAFPAPLTYLPNHGSVLLRLKATTLPTSNDVLVYFGTRE